MSLFKNIKNYIAKTSEEIAVNSRRQDIDYLKSQVVDTILKSRLQGGGLSVSEIAEVLSYIESNIEQEILDRKTKALEVLKEVEYCYGLCSQSSNLKLKI